MSERGVITLEQPANEVEPVTPMQMVHLAVEKGASIEQLTKLMDLQERWEANNARKAFVAARAAFKAEAPSIVKNKHVGFAARNGGSRTDYDHATLDNVADTLSPILARHGLSYSWETEQPDNLVRVTCILSHELGHSERVTLTAAPDQSGNKNSIQAIGSTVTFLQRYTLLAACGIATKDQDDDGAGAGSGSLIDARQKQTIIDMIRDQGMETRRFLETFRIGSVDELPAARFDEAKMRLNEYGQAKARAEKRDA